MENAYRLADVTGCNISINWLHPVQPQITSGKPCDCSSIKKKLRTGSFYHSTHAGSTKSVSARLLVGKPCMWGWLILAVPCPCSALPTPPSPCVPGGAEPWRNTSGSLEASHLQTTVWKLKSGERKAFLALFLLQTGSDNHCPLFLRVSRGELRKAQLSCTVSAVTQHLPGLPDPLVVQAQQEAQACAGGWAGWELCYHCTQHTQQHTNTSLVALLRVLGCSACVGTQSASKNIPFSADIYHPLHQPVPGAAGMPGTSPGLIIPVDIPPFHFQPCRVGMDWRRFSAIDVEVARKVDVATLQEHVASVTFCNLDGERCPHCGQLVDPILLKVFRMAQLSIEYLLHCQEYLGTSLTMHAQRLQAAHTELACTQQQAAEQAAQLQGAKEESRRWKKLIAMHQLLLQAGPNTYCKCHLCDKAFMNNSFLQAHVQRRHAEATEAGEQWDNFSLHFPRQELADCALAHSTSVSLSFAERQKMKQVEQMEDEVEELKAKLQEMQQQLEVEREAEKLRREQETERAHQREEEDRRDLEKWKEEERTKLHDEIDGLRQLFLTAFKDMASRNSAMEGKLQKLQAREAAVSNLGTLQNDDTEEARGQTPSRAELWGEQKRMAVQLKKENKTLCATLSQDQQAVMDCFHQQMDALSTCLREQPKVTKSQEKAIKLLSASKPEVTWEVTKVVVDKESYRKEAALGGKQRLLEALRRNPNLLKQFRPILEEVLEEKLESMGVKRVTKGISTQTYKSLQALVRLQQQQKAEKFPVLLHLRDELVRAVMGKVRRCNKPSTTLPRQLSIIPAQSPKSPRSLHGSQPMAIPAAVEPEASVIPSLLLGAEPTPPTTPRGLPGAPCGPPKPAVPTKDLSHGGVRKQCWEGRNLPHPL
ncbi:LOW QUALITY PROTEIN: cilium assembly protein DZIP1L [Theristicus caerulescens]